jgi:AcrR family transcriptional regulator
MPKPPSRSTTRDLATASVAPPARLVDATIACLHCLGYAETAMTAVADKAEVSRGAMTHQFTAETDLMLEVVRELFRRDGEQYQRSVNATSPAQWMKTLTSMMWDVVLCKRPIPKVVLTGHLAEDGHALSRVHRLELHFDEGQDRRIGAVSSAEFRLVVHDKSMSASILYPRRIGKTSRSAFSCGSGV